jgi:steroid Delta-isomerase
MSFTDTILDYFAAIRAKDRQAWLDTFTPGAELVHEDPVGTPARGSQAELAQFWEFIHSLFETVSLEADEIYPGGAEVAVRWTGTGRGRNGVDVEFSGIDIFEADGNDKIRSLRAWWDAPGTLSKLT